MFSVDESIVEKEVLVIDDDDVIREKIRRLLKGSQFKVQEASSGHQAKQLLESHGFDCVLLDQRLGEDTGLELMPVIRNLLKRPCPIIMITSQSDERLIIEAMRSGIYDYINKRDLDIEHLSTTIGAGLRWAQLEKELSDSQLKLQYLSLYDELTTLPNRHLFFDRLEQARLLASRESIGFAILMMDLNLFKEVNDTFGHAYGDEILRQVGLRLLKVARESDTFARLGGDEFAAILPHVDSEKNAKIVIEKITHAIHTPFMVFHHPVSIGISIGVSFYSKKKDSTHTLLANADCAMYKAKLSSRGYVFYDEEKCEIEESETDSPTSTMRISGYFSKALENDEFSMVYQPIINLSDGSCAGLEALARWSSPILGVVSPVEFMQVAERSPLLLKMSYHLVNLAIKQLGEWCTQGVMIPLSVNLSAKMFDSEELVENILLILKKHKVPPELLTIEITETALLKNPANAVRVITQLNNQGIRISIDDFGTGYTSFKYLRQFLFNELKIDKLFVTLLEEKTRDASIVQSFISLSEGFNITLIAEGVEDLERLMLLREMGCGRAQGYFISKPLVGNQFISWLKTWDEKAEFLFSEEQLRLNESQLLARNRLN